MDDTIRNEAGGNPDLGNEAASSTEAPGRAEPPIAPVFLTREEYEQIGDDPAPLPRGFEVIEGGAGFAGSSEKNPPELDSESPYEGGLEPKSEGSPAEREPAVDSTTEPGSELTQTVGSFISEGMGAVREMSAAKRAHADARETLAHIEQSILAQQAELTHRREIARNHEQITRDQAARRDEALKARTRAEAGLEALNEKIEHLRQRLKEMNDSDSQAEKRLKAAVDAAEAKKVSSRDSVARLQRRLDEAERSLERAQIDKDSSLAAAQAAIEEAAARLAMLREEYAEVQRNPSANSAAYSVRSGELELEISDAARELAEAKDSHPLVAHEAECAIEAARKKLDEAKRPIDGAKRSYEAAAAEADSAREQLESAKSDAAKRQRELRDQISAQEKAAGEFKYSAEQARVEAADAQAAIDEADEIHRHPEVTEKIAAELARSEARLSEQTSEVESLAAAERDVRERTRESRLRFMGAVAGLVALAVITAILLFMGK